jgi:HSP20 family protein
MKPYACYPKTRAGYRAPVYGLVNPYFTPFTKEAEKTTRTGSLPAANILREEGAYKIQLAVPGLTKEQIRIELNEDQLVITGPAAHDTEGTKPKFVRHEFDYTGFKRTFRLHKNANISAMTAVFENGILTIVIPDAIPETIKINIQ